MFGIKTKLSSAQLIGLSVACALLTFMVVVVFDILGTKAYFFSNHALYLYEMYMLPIWIIAVLLFLGFTKLKIGYNKHLNMISSATFGVYLIHDNELVSTLLWGKVFKNASYANSILLIPLSLIAAILVFVGCSIIELGRKSIIEKNINPLICKLSTLIDYKIKPLVSNKISELLR